jgi:hypothetical protein
MRDDIPMQTVFALSATVVRPPFMDRSPVDSRSLGLFRSLDLALVWTRSSALLERFDPEDGRVLCLEIVEKQLDVGPSDFQAVTKLSVDGNILERLVCGQEDEPWRGRDPSTCRWKRGDIVACVSYDQYRVGVVLALPPSIDWARERTLELSGMDDAYLIGFAGDDLDHAHPRDADLFEPLGDVAEAHRVRLEQRLRN